MPNIITRNFRLTNIENFLDSVTNDSIYFTFSNPTSWVSGASTPVDNNLLSTDVYNDMLYAKKVSASSCSRVVKTYYWRSGLTYQEYSDSVSIDVLTNVNVTLRPYYVITGSYNVYRCIDNNSATASTVEPTHTSGTSTLGDSYQWEYLYTLTSEQIANFYSSNWFPVSDTDAIQYLNATNLMIKVRVSGSESGTIVDGNDYRQIAIVKDPYTFGTTTVATGNLYNQCHVINIPATASLTPDTFVTGPTSGASGILVLHQTTGATQIYVTAVGATSYAAGETLDIGGVPAVAGTITLPGLDYNSGKVIYIENRNPITRFPDQIEDIRVIIQF
jgi:hypothetical protein